MQLSRKERGRGAQGGEHGLNDSITLREITNEAWERAMYKWMKRIERQIETLTTILHELRNEQRRAGDVSMVRDGVALKPSS